MKGFTRIELVIVLAVIGIFVLVVFPKYTEMVEKSYAAEAVQMLNYMHRQAELYNKKQEEPCWRKKNKELEISFGKNFTCRWTGESEVCCNGRWCYDNNSFTWGDKCAVASNLTPVAARVSGIPSDFTNVRRKYLLEMEDCEGGSGRIVCYESDGWCKLFGGEGKPID